MMISQRTHRQICLKLAALLLLQLTLPVVEMICAVPAHAAAHQTEQPAATHAEHLTASSTSLLSGQETAFPADSICEDRRSSQAHLECCLFKPLKVDQTVLPVQLTPADTALLAVVGYVFSSPPEKPLFAAARKEASPPSNVSVQVLVSSFLI